jgi:hypothetical protein
MFIIPFGPVPTCHELPRYVEVKSLSPPLKRHSGCFKLLINSADDLRQIADFERLEKECIVVLQEDLDGEVAIVAWREQRPLPTTVEDEVEQFGNGALRHYCDCFPERLWLVGPVEEDELAAQRSGEGTVRVQLLIHPPVPRFNSREGGEVKDLKLINDPRRDSNSGSDAIATPIVITSVRDTLGYITVGQTA